jgi:DNA-binding NtrC family response regulator
MKISGFEEGADEYIVKPFSPMELKARINSLLTNRQLMRENLEQEERIASLTRSLETRCTYQNIVGQSKQMEKIYQIMELTKNTERPLLITGETGTGKELIAKTIHYIGDKKNKPYIVQNCSAFSENLLESEIFGHVKGAFTGAIQDKKGLFEMANGGTLFLDEIGELSQNTQAKLLRILEYGTFYPLGGNKEKKVKVKLITATNKDLKSCIKERTFREDLYYRLNVINIALPPLRERKEDILLLIEHFIEELNKNNTEKKHFTKPALKRLMEYSYPGNIRELKNIIDKAYILCPGKAIQPEDLTSEVLEKTIKVTNITKPLNHPDQPTHKIKLQQLIDALKTANKNKRKAAEILNITRPTLYKIIKLYNINLDNL